MEEEKLATDETNENMEKDKIIDNGNVISYPQIARKVASLGKLKALPSRMKIQLA
jgi:hypothetical protein